MLVKKIVIEPGSGRLGNQMMQLMIAQRLLRGLPGYQVQGYDMPDWRLSNLVRQGHPYCPLLVRGAGAPWGLIGRLCRLGLADSVLMRSVSLDYRWFLSREEANELFVALPEEDAPGFGPEYLVINVRGEDILFGKAGDYGPIPIEYYRQLIAETGLKPVFMGQLFDDYYSQLIRSSFPDAIYVPHTTVIGDFQVIRNSKNIVVSVSTFSWLAAWMSNADRIYMPLLGSCNPLQRPDINLTPTDDPRFVFDLFPHRIWKATPEQIASLTTERTFQRVTTADVESLRRKTALRRFFKQSRKNLQMLSYLGIHLLGRLAG